MDDRYYWLKLHRDFFKNHKIAIIEGMRNGKDYILFYLKLLCESIDHEGRLRFSDRIPYNEDMLASLTKTDIDIVRSAIKVFVETELMEILDDGTMYMTEVQKMIGSQANNANARRQASFRERQKQKQLQSVEISPKSVTKSNGVVTDSVTNDNEENRDKENRNITSSSKDSEVKKNQASKRPDPTPYKEIVDLYYELCPTMSKARPIVALSDQIKSNMKARWREYNCDIELFKTMFRNAEASDFLNCRIENGYQGSFGFLMQKQKFSKAINGEYNDEHNEFIKGTNKKMSLVADGSNPSKYTKTEWD